MWCRKPDPVLTTTTLVEVRQTIAGARSQIGSFRPPKEAVPEPPQTVESATDAVRRLIPVPLAEEAALRRRERLCGQRAINHVLPLRTDVLKRRHGCPYLRVHDEHHALPEVSAHRPRDLSLRGGSHRDCGKRGVAP
jgi:hypothetical protein